MPVLTLPRGTTLERYTVAGVPLPLPQAVRFNRVTYAAAHVVANPLADIDPWLGTEVDWDTTMRFRHHLWDLGFGVAEAMDTAQRGMGLDWAASLELITRAQREAATRDGAVIACGVGTDHLAPGASIDQVIAAYEMQMEAVEAVGGRLILMASRGLVKAAHSPDDYARVYDRVLSQVREPVIIHWLGEMFDPALAGYWGHADHHAAMEVCLGILQTNAAKVDGIKISLLSKEKEILLRRRLPAGMRMYTGDDFNYAELIAGDEHGHSDALLGIFDAIAPVASSAMASLAAGDAATFHRVLEPTVALSRHIFQAPTRFYKTGVVFMAYLNGLQDHFCMVGGQESTRSLQHLAELFRLADQARCLVDPELATTRMARLLAVHGVM